MLRKGHLPATLWLLSGVQVQTPGKCTCLGPSCRPHSPVASPTPPEHFLPPSPALLASDVNSSRGNVNSCWFRNTPESSCLPIFSWLTTPFLTMMALGRRADTVPDNCPTSLLAGHQRSVVASPPSSYSALPGAPSQLCSLSFPGPLTLSGVLTEPAQLSAPGPPLAQLSCPLLAGSSSPRLL